MRKKINKFLSHMMEMFHLQNKFVGIVGNRRASHLFHRSTHMGEDSLVADSNRFAETVQDWNYQYVRSVHQSTLWDRQPTPDSMLFRRCAHPQCWSASGTRNSQSLASFSAEPAACPQSEDTAAADRKPAECTS
jgi:hypothetical protein